MIYTPRDERPHTPSENSDWVEAWLFDVVQHDMSIGVSIELLVWPQHGQAAFHTSVIQVGQRLISLVEVDAVAPRAPSLEVRASGLWTDVGIQTPFDHMTVDIEAFAVQLDSPDDVFSGAYGVRTPLGCELEWEAAADPRQGAASTSYEVPCITHGELLLGSEVIEIDGWGWRSHRWGRPTAADRTRVRGRTAGGDWFAEPSSDRELTMAVIGAAPVPDPARDAGLLQFLARNDSGDAAWIRRARSL